MPKLEELRSNIADFQRFRQERLRIISDQQAAAASQSRSLLFVFGLVWLTLSVILGSVVSRSIVKPLALAVTHLGDVARGDISKDLPKEIQERGDEIGIFTKAMQTMSVSLREVLKDVASGVHVLSSSSAELSANSGQMSEGGRQASDKAHAVAAAAEQMTSNVIVGGGGDGADQHQSDAAWRPPPSR